MLIKRVMRLVVSGMPVIIVVVLLYVAFFVKPQPGKATLKPYPIVRRDYFYGVAMPTPTTIWAVGSHGKVVRSDDAGKSWVVQATPTLVHLQDIAAWDDKRACAVGTEGVVLVTRDGGKSWTQVKTPLDEVVKVETAGGLTVNLGTTEAMSEEKEEGPVSQVAKKLMVVRASPDGSAWAVGEMGAVLYSKDFGKTWERRMKPEDVGWNDCFFLGQKGWIIGEFGRIMRTDDGGITWTAVKAPLTPDEMGVVPSIMGVAFRDEEHGVAVGLGGMILITEDGGKRWVKVPEVTREHLFRVIWDGAQWVAVGDKGIMFKGDPSGVKWSGGRITDLDTSWYTAVWRIGDRYYLAGDRLARLEKGVVEFFDRKR